ncbi:Isocitrate dehydrogenase [NADP] [subsurface metagenome]
MTDVTLVTGDGIGPEIAEATRRCIDATGADINWLIKEAGTDVMEREGTPLPDATVEAIKKTGVALKAPITTPVGKGFRSINVHLRQTLDLYACLRPCKSYEGVRSRYTDIDLVVVRENTEDCYAGVEFQRGKDDTDELINWINKRSEKKVRENSGITIAGNNMCMQLIQKPELYDVLVLPNLYGDILSDLCAGLVGGLGVAPGGNIGEKGAIFEATHGSAPKYKGQNKVNPTALILSGVLMLRHMGKIAEAEKLENAVAAVIAEGKSVTYDMKPHRDDPTAVGTSQMADAIIEKMM